jgi:hypothetical protein
MRKVLIVGATSAIAEATARLLAGDGDRLFLVARREDRLQAIAADLVVRGADRVRWQTLDINDLERHDGAWNEAEQALDGIDLVLVAHGTLPDQALCQMSTDMTMAELRTNATSTIALLTLAAERLEQQGAGRIAVITSVAADRGRQSNYVYGAAKAAVDTFLEGLRQRLFKSGVGVTTIRPGFIDTPMTRAMDKGFLWTRPDDAARHIHRAIRRGRDVVYVPPYWRWIMLVIRLMPRAVFKRVTL